MKRKLYALLGVTALVVALPAASAQQQSDLVAVDVSDIRADIAKNLNIDVNQVPMTIEVPVGVAANVCNVQAATLAPGASYQSSGCKARAANVSLNPFVERSMGSSRGNAGVGAHAGRTGDASTGNLAPKDAAQAEAKATGEGNATGPVSQDPNAKPSDSGANFTTRDQSGATTDATSTTGPTKPAGTSTTRPSGAVSGKASDASSKGATTPGGAAATTK